MFDPPTVRCSIKVSSERTMEMVVQDLRALYAMAEVLRLEALNQFKQHSSLEVYLAQRREIESWLVALQLGVSGVAWIEHHEL